jgi:Fe-S-cluster containining protein
MKLFHPQPWYVNGLAFECAQCGQCCAGPNEGYVWVNDAEVAALAAALNIAEDDFRNIYLRRVGRHFSLVEEPKTKDCIFLLRQDGKIGCKVYDARPGQCRAWPFWRSNLHDAENWCLASQRCPGVNRGNIFAKDEIELRQSWTQI